MDQINERVRQAAEQLARSRLRLAHIESIEPGSTSVLAVNERKLCVERQKTLQRVIREEGWTFDVGALDEEMRRCQNTVRTRDDAVRVMSFSYLREALLTIRDEED